jgi:F420-0:gamma-glutamyl ligase
MRKKFNLKKLGVIITDSHSIPLRRGSIGFALGYFGFKPLRSYLGKRHLTGRNMRMTRANLVDGLAAAAVLTMGEGGEQTPFAILRDVPGMEFINKPFVPRGKFEKFEVSIKEDIFRPILDNNVWKKKKHPGRR